MASGFLDNYIPYNALVTSGAEMQNPALSTDRTLTQEQINAVLGLINPKQPSSPEWGDLISKGNPVDLTDDIANAVSKKLSSKMSYGGSSNLQIPTSLEQGQPNNGPKIVDEEMEKAQAEMKSNLIGTALASAGSDIGFAIAGAQDRGPSIYERMKEISVLPVEQLKEKRKALYDKFSQEKDMMTKMEAADPNSAHSVGYRNLAKSMLDMQGLQNISKAIDGLSAEQIDKRFPMISNIVTAKMAQDAKKETTALLAATKEETKQGKEELRHQDWLTNRLEKELTSKETKNLEKIMHSVDQIDASLRDPSGIADIATLYSFIKGIDPESAVREGEVKLGREALTAFENIKSWSSNFSKNNKRLLTPQAIQDIRTLSSSMREAAKESYLRRVEYVRNQGLDRGLSPERIDRSLGVLLPKLKSIDSQSKQDPKISQFASENKVTYDQAKKFLIEKRGYTPNE